MLQKKWLQKSSYMIRKWLQSRAVHSHHSNSLKYILKWQESFGHRKCVTVVWNYGNLGRVNENLQGPAFQIYLEVWWVCEPNTCYDYLISNRDGSRSCMLRLTGLSMTVIVFMLRGIVFGGQMATFVFSKNTFRVTVCHRSPFCESGDGDGDGDYWLFWTKHMCLKYILLIISTNTRSFLFLDEV